MVKFEEILTDEEIEIARIARDEARSLLESGFVVDALNLHDDLERLHTLIIERARGGDAWARRQERAVFARLHGVAAALEWDV